MLGRVYSYTVSFYLVIVFTSCQFSSIFRAFAIIDVHHVFGVSSLQSAPQCEVFINSRDRVSAKSHLMNPGDTLGFRHDDDDEQAAATEWRLMKRIDAEDALELLRQKNGKPEEIFPLSAEDAKAASSFPAATLDEDADGDTLMVTGIVTAASSSADVGRGVVVTAAADAVAAVEAAAELEKTLEQEEMEEHRAVTRDSEVVSVVTSGEDAQDASIDMTDHDGHTQAESDFMMDIDSQGEHKALHVPSVVAMSSASVADVPLATSSVDSAVSTSSSNSHVTGTLLPSPTHASALTPVPISVQEPVADAKSPPFPVSKPKNDPQQSQSSQALLPECAHPSLGKCLSSPPSLDSRSSSLPQTPDTHSFQRSQSSMSTSLAVSTSLPKKRPRSSGGANRRSRTSGSSSTTTPIVSLDSDDEDIVVTMPPSQMILPSSPMSLPTVARLARSVSDTGSRRRMRKRRYVFSNSIYDMLVCCNFCSNKWRVAKFVGVDSGHAILRCCIPIEVSLFLPVSAYTLAQFLCYRWCRLPPATSAIVM